MNRGTLAARVSWVQAALSFAALAAVVLGTSLLVSALLHRKRDAMLEEIAQRTIELVRMAGPHAQDGEWMDRELAEIRPADVRLELQDPSGFALAASGSGASLGKSDLGCHDRGSLRICSKPVGVFTAVASTDRTSDAAEHRRVLLALLSVAGVSALLVAIASRALARRALVPLTQLTEQVAAIAPGTHARLGKANDFLELELLRAHFDDLLERFDQALAREQRLSAQASHELRTPLAVARAEIEALVQTRDIETGSQRALAALDRLSAH
ncbi:MAG: hypothetical protein ACOY0T_21485 [Myxococcota bacterium]